MAGSLITESQRTKYKQGRKEMFYLTTHLAQFILWLPGIRRTRGHGDNERGNPLPPVYGILFSISSKGPTDRIAHTMVFVTSVVEHWLEREIAQ